MAEASALDDPDCGKPGVGRLRDDLNATEGAVVDVLSVIPLEQN